VGGLFNFFILIYGRCSASSRSSRGGWVFLIFFLNFLFSGVEVSIVAEARMGVLRGSIASSQRLPGKKKKSEKYSLCCLFWSKST
jgi:hypothetical protein